MGLASITHKHLLLCEGMHDVQFFQFLGQARGLPNFQATSCGNIVGAPPGRDGIDHLTGALNALPGIPTFFSRLENILIVADNDGDPKKSFQKVQNLIAATAEIAPGVRYPVPASELTASGTKPAITVMMLPWTHINGALDSLCYISAARSRPEIARCVDEFARCTKTDIWPMTKLAKMKLRSLMSAVYHQDPYLSPAWVWREGTDLVPLSDSTFDQIDSFLRSYLV